MDGINRRDLFLTGLTLGIAGGEAFGRSPGIDGAQALTTPAAAEVATRSGRIRGFCRRGVFVFRGIPYAADPSGASRFLAPQPPPPWPGIRSALAYGAVCPQPARDWSNDEMAFIADWNDGHPSENCLTLNVWSRTLAVAAPLPVIVWLHGGGFTTGSSHELPAYDGSRLAARGVIVVSVNHRLGAFGFMDLSAYGAEYASSGNVGLLDIVLALQWVRDNIAQFGGDPHCVTIAGQSGGGGKVSALMAMPLAQGLFHRTMVMSGSFAPVQPQADARAVAEATFAELQLRRGDVAALSAVPPARLVEAGDAVIRRLRPSGGIPGIGRGPLKSLSGWGPVGDGQIVPADCWQSAAPEVSQDIPMLVGNVRDEFKLSSMVFDAAGLEKFAAHIYGDAAPRLLEALKREFPDLSPNQQAGVFSGIQFHNAAVAQCEMKARLAAASVYQYWFTYAPDLLDARIGVPHCADIAYFFDNAALCDQQTGNSPVANHVAQAASAALLRFAATGNPSGPSLRWSAFTVARKETLVIDREARMQDDPGGPLFEVARHT